MIRIHSRSSKHPKAHGDTALNIDADHVPVDTKIVSLV